jgi:hypothetical protein
MFHVLLLLMSFFFCHFCSVIGSSRTVGQINIIIIIIIIILGSKVLGGTPVHSMIESCGCLEVYVGHTKGIIA